MHPYDVLSYFRLSDNVGVPLDILTQYNKFHNRLVSTLNALPLLV